MILYKAPKSEFLGDLEESRIDQLLVEGVRDRLATHDTVVRSAARVVSDRWKMDHSADLRSRFDI